MINLASYRNGEYLDAHPDWHEGDSSWKAGHVLRMLEHHQLYPRRVAEVGCGAGAILSELQCWLDEECEFWGYEISPQALQMCQARANARLHYVERSLPSTDEHPQPLDLLLVMDVLEHVENYIDFLRTIRPLAEAKFFHVPLDLSVQGLLRNIPGRLRVSAGHVHYFTKELCLQCLKEADYRIVDYFYTLPAVEGAWQSTNSRLASLPRRLMFRVQQDWTALLLGGCSLFIYAE